MSSFGKAKRDGSLNKSSLMPGPGNYNSNGRGSTPSYSIGRSERSTMKASNGPGPGQYQTISGSQRGVSMGLRTSYGSAMGSLGKDGSNPGPGHYQSSFNDGSKSAAYTFGIKTGSALSTKNAGGPGPGQYNLRPGSSDDHGRNSNNTSRGPGFGTEKRAIGGITKSAVEIPGPGQYSIDQYGSHAPRIGFGTATREKGGLTSKETKLVPGPGQYNTDEIIGKSAAKVSMKFRPQTAQARTLDAPGPGQYDPNLQSVKTGALGSRIGTAKRDGLAAKENMPGPGHFSIGDDWQNGKNRRNAGFGSSKRNGLSQSRDNIPGPGNYNPTERVVASNAPQYTMGTGGRSGLGGKNQLPGPGQYNPRVDYAKENMGTGVKIGTSPRGNKYRNDIPGPGNYNVTGRLGGPSYGIGSSNRNHGHADSTPGPGHYKLPVYVASLPRYQMPDKPESLRYV